MATKANITIDQGTTFNTIISLTDDAGNALDLIGYTGESQMRKWYTSNNYTNFTLTLANGQVQISLDANTTSALSSGRYVYDVILTDSTNTVTRVVEGIVTVTPRVSQ